MNNLKVCENSPVYGAVKKDIELTSIPELLAAVTGKDLLSVTDIWVKKCLRRFDTLLNSPQLFTVKQFARIKAALELSIRKNLQSSTDAIQSIKRSRDAFYLLHPHLHYRENEAFLIILLNTACKVMSIKTISEGGRSGTVVDSKVLFKTALLGGASFIVLAHNHPSGNVSPSQSDISLTKKLVSAGKNLDIKVLDHIIIGGETFFSFADEGYI